MSNDATFKGRILVTGATGYVGGRLVTRLVDEGYNVRVMTRNQRHLQGRNWLNRVEVVEADVLEPDTLNKALQDVDAAYYLIHSMYDTDNYYERDAQAAGNFVKAADAAGVQRILYLGGLGDADEDLSKHLESRQHVGSILRKAEADVLEYRAAVVIGSGSISFEMIRHLTERLPVMLCPSWLYTPTQPIAVRDVITYLISGLTVDIEGDAVVEIGGPERMTYRNMITGYGKARKLRRIMIPIPLLFPRLSSYWVHWLTPIPAKITRPLAESLRNATVVTDDSARRLFPDIHPMNFTEAINLALDELNAHSVETTWTDSMAATWRTEEPYTFVEERGMLIEQRVRHIDADPMTIYQTFVALGGEVGWLHWNFLWRIRGLMDRVMGGVGYRYGRRHPSQLRVGDPVDFWRVEAIKPGELLRLRAEMLMPGRGWLQFQVKKDEESNRSKLVQTAYFAPKGLFGNIYWYALYFAHKQIFDGMINKVCELSEAQAKSQEQEKAQEIAEATPS